MSVRNLDEQSSILPSERMEAAFLAYVRRRHPDFAADTPTYAELRDAFISGMATMLAVVEGKSKSKALAIARAVLDMAKRSSAALSIVRQPRG